MAGNASYSITVVYLLCEILENCSQDLVGIPLQKCFIFERHETLHNHHTHDLLTLFCGSGFELVNDFIRSCITCIACESHVGESLSLLSLLSLDLLMPFIICSRSVKEQYKFSLSFSNFSCNRVFSSFVHYSFVTVEKRDPSWEIRIDQCACQITK